MNQSYIIYIKPSNATFIKKDLDILSKRYHVKTSRHVWPSNIFLIPLFFVNQFLFLSKNIFSAKAIFVMFGGYWALLPTLFGKIFGTKVYIILGGTDCVSFPSLNYGSLRKPLLKMIIKWSYMLASKLIPVDESLVFNKYSYYQKADYEFQGAKFFFPKLKTPFKVIHNGFTPGKFSETIDVNNKITNSFITVALISDITRFKLKGIDLIFELARHYNECSFSVIGMAENVLREVGEAPPNITYYPFLKHDELQQYLAKSEFVLQLSISEGFPNALCEAMLHKCIPVGSSVGAIPHIIDDTGFIVRYSEFDYLKVEFDKIINLSSPRRTELANMAYNRIVNHFNLTKRENQLFELIELN